SKHPEPNHVVRTTSPDHRRDRLGAVDLRRTTEAHRAGNRAGPGQCRRLRHDHDDELRSRIRARARVGLHRWRHPQIRALRGGRASADDRGPVAAVPSHPLRRAHLPGPLPHRRTARRPVLRCRSHRRDDEHPPGDLPGLPFWPTAIVVLLSAAVLVAIGRYGLVEKAMMGFGVLMFFGVLALAISLLQGQDARAVAAGTIVPTFPNISIITVMSLIGGVGGATGILAYSFWIREKSWRSPGWKSVVRLDLIISYGLVFVFAVAMSAVGAFILYGQGFTISDNDALFAIADSLVGRIGDVGRMVFLISFLAVVYTSVLGGFSGIAYVTADCLRVLRRYPHQDEAKHEMSAKSVEFRGALVYLSIPP